jgi:predicted small secreted protein
MLCALFTASNVGSQERKRKRMKTADLKLLSLTGVMLLVNAFIAGCNTVEGVGRDIEEVGDEISDEARDARD